MISKSLFMMLCLCIFLSQPLAAQTLTVDQVLQNMEKANALFPTLQANITRTHYKDFVKIVTEPDFGKIWILQSGNAPRRIKVEFEKPVKEILLIDKGAFVHYNPSTKDGETKSFGKEEQAEGECVFLGLCQSTAVIKKFYDATLLPAESIDGIKTTVLELKPKNRNRTPGFASIRLWLDPEKWIPLQTRITEDNKNYTNAKYSDIKMAKFSDSVFDFKIPAGASIRKLK